VSREIHRRRQMDAPALASNFAIRSCVGEGSDQAIRRKTRVADRPRLQSRMPSTQTRHICYRPK
jgi:hypothetical protein